ncbi:MAG: hypothetical protein IPP88_14075 [Betaproteobacteria bacterium]|nr:hypothetical protein [Betaproteobacteria bacterium]
MQPCRALAINNGAMGAQIASVTTDSRGNFALSLGTYTGPVMPQMSGASVTSMRQPGQSRMMAANAIAERLLPTVAQRGECDRYLDHSAPTAMAQGRALGSERRV